MDLVLVSSELDIVGVKSEFCSECLERKLNTKILAIYYKSLTLKEYKIYKEKYNLKGYIIECECKNISNLILDPVILKYKEENINIDKIKEENINIDKIKEENIEINKIKEEEIKIDEKQFNIATNYTIDLSMAEIK